MPQTCFASKTRSIQSHTVLITNVTTEPFISILNEDHASEFPKILDLILIGYGRIEIDSNTLFVKFIMEKLFKFLKLFLEPAITPVASIKAKKCLEKSQFYVIIENHHCH